MILEEHIEEAVKSLLSANAAIITMVAAGLVVRDFRDNSQAKASKMIVVHAEPAQRLAPNANFWRVQVAVLCVTHQAVDKSRATCESIYQAAMSVVGAATKTTISAKLPAGSSVTIDGIVQGPGEEGADESHQFITIKADIFATIAP